MRGKHIFIGQVTLHDKGNRWILSQRLALQNNLSLKEEHLASHYLASYVSDRTNWTLKLQLDYCLL